MKIKLYLCLDLENFFLFMNKGSRLSSLEHIMLFLPFERYRGTNQKRGKLQKLFPRFAFKEVLC